MSRNPRAIWLDCQSQPDLRIWGQVDLHIDLAQAPGRSLRARLEHALREAMRSGRLAAGERLPSTRELAAGLGVSRGVVVDAYAQLAAEGYLRTARGGGTRVAAAIAPTSRPHPISSPARADRIRYDLSPFRPALGAIPRRTLIAALARVLRDTPDERLGLPDPAGTLELRAALSSYLGRVRGVQAAAEQLVITNGTRNSLGLVWRALAAEGLRRVAIEDPGWSGVAETALDAGLHPVPVPVDEAGLRIDELSTRAVEAVAVAPAHQYPTGAVLSPRRRTAILDWARAGARLVIEDDYDAEYRYDHQPIGSLQGLAPDHVIYAGSSSKTVAPSLRLGWLVVPPRLRDRIVELKRTAGTTPSPIFQLAFAELIERGELDRHLRRQRRRYQQQRAALLAALGTELPELTVHGAAAGLYAVMELPHELDETAVLKAARARGLALEGRGAGAPGLVIGYADIDATAIKPAVSELAASIDDARRAD
jgi:GntR family transcriptional regulator / MocR family aminotransferase